MLWVPPGLFNVQPLSRSCGHLATARAPFFPKEAARRRVWWRAHRHSSPPATPLRADLVRPRRKPAETPKPSIRRGRYGQARFRFFPDLSRSDNAATPGNRPHGERVYDEAYRFPLSTGAARDRVPTRRFGAVQPALAHREPNNPPVSGRTAIANDLRKRQIVRNGSPIRSRPIAAQGQIPRRGRHGAKPPGGEPAAIRLRDGRSIGGHDRVHPVVVPPVRATEMSLPRMTTVRRRMVQHGRASFRITASGANTSGWTLASGNGNAQRVAGGNGNAQRSNGVKQARRPPRVAVIPTTHRA